jgi:hypothetical protein
MNTSFLLSFTSCTSCKECIKILRIKVYPLILDQNTEWSIVSSAPNRCAKVSSATAAKIIRHNTYKHETRIVLISPTERWECPLMYVFSVHTMAPMMCVTRYNKTRFQHIHQLQITTIMEYKNRNWYPVFWLTESFLGYLTTLF